MTLPSTSIQAELCATLVDEWLRSGVRYAVVSPGSRSSALALALFGDPRLKVYVRLDERSGAFFALGLALRSKGPVVLVTTSGTAAAELHAAVVEADLARVPLIVATADRPVELHSVGAPQSIDQVHIFGGSVRYFLDLHASDDRTRPFWRSFASRLLGEATAGPKGPGPVHVNVAFREPMLGDVGELPASRPAGLPWHTVLRSFGVDERLRETFQGLIDAHERAVIVTGGARLRDEQVLLQFARRRGWPILSDARALHRNIEDVLISHADQFLRVKEVRSELVCDLVIHVGSPHASKTLMNWYEELSSAGTRHIVIDPFGTFEDVDRSTDLLLGVDPLELFAASETTGVGNSAWIATWRGYDDAAGATIDAVLAKEQLNEPMVARSLFAHARAGSTLVCSSSMPVRDIEWFARPRRAAPLVLSNRGANGIDGVISTVFGAAAATEGPTYGLVGDLALLHDLSAFVWGEHEALPDVTLVVVDNGGGGIFSFLSYPALIDTSVFERLFATPQRGDLAPLLEALGASVIEVASRKELEDALQPAAPREGITVILVRTERHSNVDVHGDIAREVAASVLALRASRAFEPSP